MKRGLVGLLLVAGIAARAEYSSDFHWQVDAGVVDFSYAQLRLIGGRQYFMIGDTIYAKVDAETPDGASLGQSTLAVARRIWRHMRQASIRFSSRSSARTAGGLQ